MQTSKQAVRQARKLRHDVVGLLLLSTSFPSLDPKSDAIELGSSNSLIFATIIVAFPAPSRPRSPRRQQQIGEPRPRSAQLYLNSWAEMLSSERERAEETEGREQSSAGGGKKHIEEGEGASA